MMKKLSPQEEEYCKSVLEVEESNLIENAFANYFGAFFTPDLKKKIHQIKIHVYHLNKKAFQNRLQALKQKMELLQIQFLLKCLENFNIVLPKDYLFSIYPCFEKDPFLKEFFGASFLKDFLLEHVQNISAFSYLEWSTSKQQAFLLSAYPHMPFSISHQNVLQGIQICKKEQKNLSLLLKKIQKCSLLIQQYQEVHPFFIHRIAFSSSHISFIEKIVLQYVLLKYTTALGMHCTTSSNNNVLISMYSSLRVLFHEVSHQLIEQILAISNQKPISAFFGMIPYLSLNGIFPLNTPESVFAMEAFNDYFVMESMETIEDFQYEGWKYLIQEDMDYTQFFCFVEPFMASFGDLMKYAMLNQQSYLIYEVVSKPYFADFLSLFQKNKNDLDERKEKMNLVMKNMIAHAKDYSNTYSTVVQEYMEQLKAEGKQVRVLKKGMEKLKLEEKLIDSTIQNLIL